MKNIDVKGKGKIFSNPILELLTKTNPYITIIVYGSYVVLSLIFSFQKGYTGLISGLFLFLTGYLSWTLVEYLMHRYLFHWINESDFAKRFHYTIHGVHHTYPNDYDRLFMPPVPGTILSAIFLSSFYLLMGTYAFIFFAAFLCGYMTYAFIHYSTHKVRRPAKFWRPLWHHHHLHHFKYDDKAFGVSSMLWDYVFGTMPPKEDRYKG